MDQSEVAANAGPDEGPAVAGALLREARLRSSMSLEDCALALRARPRQVEALERGDLSSFGGEIYARGFLRSYARLVDVDPKEILRLHGEDPAFRGPVLPPREPLRIRRDPPGWLVGLVGIVVVAGAVTAVLGLGGSRVPLVVGPSDPALDDPDGQAGPAPTAPEPSPIAPDPVPAPEPSGPPVDLVLTFEAASWLEVLVDGIPVQAGVLVAAGETLRFGGQQTVSLLVGNAGGVRVELNGEDLGTVGRPQQVLRVAYGPEGNLEAPATSSAGGG